MFFVISGYLISNLIFSGIKNNSFTLGNFFIRRELKIYPPFLLLIIVSVTFFTLRHHPFSFQQVVAELFFFQNYHEGLWNHTWSLAVEEHFYVLLPCLLIVLRRNNKMMRLPAILLTVMASGLILRIINFQMHPGSTDQRLFYMLSHLRMDSFVPGVLVAFFRNYNEPVYRKLIQLPKTLLLAIFTAPIVILWFLSEFNFFMLTVEFTLLSFGFAALLIVFMAADQARFDNAFCRLMALIGKSSYQIYLWHMCVMYWFMSLIEKTLHLTLPYYMSILIFMLVSVVLGIFMDKALEQPVLRFRERYFPSLTKKSLS